MASDAKYTKNYKYKTLHDCVLLSNEKFPSFLLSCKSNDSDDLLLSPIEDKNYKCVFWKSHVDRSSS